MTDPSLTSEALDTIEAETLAIHKPHEVYENYEEGDEHKYEPNLVICFECSEDHVEVEYEDGTLEYESDGGIVTFPCVPFILATELRRLRTENEEQSLTELLIEHQPSQWRSFTTDEIVYRCCGQDFGPVSKKRGKDSPTPYALWVEHVASAYRAALTGEATT
jgi:hypothetical protein